MRISDWSSDVCSSDLWGLGIGGRWCAGRRSFSAVCGGGRSIRILRRRSLLLLIFQAPSPQPRVPALLQQQHVASAVELGTGRELGDQEGAAVVRAQRGHGARSEEHTSELQSLMRISYAVFLLKKKN